MRTKMDRQWHRASFVSAEHGIVDGFLCGNVGVYSRQGWAGTRSHMVWLAVHQPLGLGLFKRAPLLRNAKKCVEALLEKFGEETFDRLADRGEPFTDDDVIKECKRIIKSNRCY